MLFITVFNSKYLYYVSFKVNLNLRIIILKITQRNNMFKMPLINQEILAGYLASLCT